jgi:hypothetical protein
MRLRFGVYLVGVACAVLAGGASSQGVALTGETLMLGEVRHVLTRQLLQSGRISASDAPRDLTGLLKKQGWTEAQLDEGRLVVVRVQIYWNNTVSGVVRDQLDVVLSDAAPPLVPGNVVEFTATSLIKRVRANTLAEGACYYGNVPVGSTVELLGNLSRVGPRGSASLYCKGIETEGWHRPRTFWHKLPDAVQGAEPIDKAPVEVPVRAASAPD